MITKIQQTITNQFRVLWKDGDYKGGYHDFNTNTEALNYINKLKNGR
jgi:hypothetical protein